VSSNTLAENSSTYSFNQSERHVCHFKPSESELERKKTLLRNNESDWKSSFIELFFLKEKTRRQKKTVITLETPQSGLLGHLDISLFRSKELFDNTTTHGEDKDDDSLMVLIDLRSIPLGIERDFQGHYYFWENRLLLVLGVLVQTLTEDILIIKQNCMFAEELVENGTNIAKQEVIFVDANYFNVCSLFFLFNPIRVEPTCTHSNRCPFWCQRHATCLDSKQQTTCISHSRVCLHLPYPLANNLLPTSDRKKRTVCEQFDLCR